MLHIYIEMFKGFAECWGCYILCRYFFQRTENLVSKSLEEGKKDNSHAFPSLDLKDFFDSAEELMMMQPAGSDFIDSSNESRVTHSQKRHMKILIHACIFKQYPICIGKIISEKIVSPNDIHL